MGKEIEYVVEESVAPSAVVWTGYSGHYLTAPKEEGTYKLMEIADENNMHLRFEWREEKTK